MNFGIYLVQKQVITADQFVDALAQQLAEVVPLGQLAIAEGMLSMKDVFAIMRSQSDVPLYRFGEAAVNLGFISENQLAQLLMVQSERKRPISEILVEHEVLSKTDVIEELAAFRRYCERSGPHGNTSQYLGSSAQQAVNC